MTNLCRRCRNFWRIATKSSRGVLQRPDFSLQTPITLISRHLNGVPPRVSPELNQFSDARLPDLDWEWLLDERNKNAIRINVRNRKGVGDIDAVHAAAARLNATDHDDAVDVLSRAAILIPNSSHPASPVGGEESVRVIDVVNQKPRFDFIPKHHVQIGEGLKALRTSYVGHTSIRKTYHLMNDFALLHRALTNYTLDRLKHSGFEIVSVPEVLDASIIEGCGFDTRGHNTAVFKVAVPETDDSVATREFCLSGTAEMGISAFLHNRVFSASELPLRLAALSRCYRAEIATRSLDRGLYRVPFFNKVEMFCVTKGNVEESETALSDLVQLQMDLFRPLGLHFRLLEMPTEELGASAFHKFDVEAWMESRQLFSEISSGSNCTDYQSRRLGIKYRDDEAVRHCHTVNATACALPRTIQAIVEHHQRSDGCVVVPEVLRPFCRGKTVLTAPKAWPNYFFNGIPKNEAEDNEQWD